jgi:hypothetical protein
MCSQESETGLFSEPEESIPHPSFLFFMIHFNIIHTSTLISSNWSVSFRFLTRTLRAFPPVACSQQAFSSYMNIKKAYDSAGREFYVIFSLSLIHTGKCVVRLINLIEWSPS